MGNITPNLRSDYQNEADEFEQNTLKERLIDLEKELLYTRQCLQTAVEDCEIAREELLSANEEFLASNQELLSIGEEYQSVNEELLRINTQYQNKILELADLDNDMTNYLNSTDIGTIFLDEKLCIRKFTPSITKVINLKNQDIGRPMNHISHNLMNDELNKGVAEVMNTLLPSEKEIQSKNGSWYLLKCAPYSTLEKPFKGVVVSLVDITSRKHAEIEQIRGRERYEQLVEHSPYAIYIIQNGKFCFSNSSGLRLLNLNDKEGLMLRHFRDYFNVNEQELMNSSVNSVYSEGKTIIPKEDRIILDDGSTLLVEISSMSIFLYGQEAKLLFVSDMSYRIIEQRLREENERSKKLLDETIMSDTLKTEFFSNLSHELRTPLNVILSTLQLLDVYIRNGDVDDKKSKLEKYTNIMKQNCYRQLRLVNNMIDITKLDAGYFELELQNCNIVNVIESTALSVSEYIRHKSIDLTFDTDIEECIIACDPDKIERVILNLLSNSIKFTKQGGSMTVNIYDKGVNIIISIKDTGIGIPKDKIGIIFDRFRQVDKSLTRKQEGSGIGLSIVKSLVELHGGIVSVLSEYGKGTEFIIELPVKLLPEENDKWRALDDESNDRIERIHIEFSDIYSLN